MNRKASSSLSNLNFKKTFDNLSNTPQLKLPLIRKKLFSQAQKKQGIQLKTQYQNSQIQDQYYKTNVDNNFKTRVSLVKLKLNRQQNFARQIEEKMKKIIQVTEQRLQKNKSSSCMIMEDQSQIDSEFQQKILENKEMLKKQRENKTINQSQKVLVRKSNKSSKKLSVLQNRSTNNTRLSLIRSKSKSTFPKNIATSPKLINKNVQQKQQQLKESVQKDNSNLLDLGSYAKFSVGINTQKQNLIQQQHLEHIQLQTDKNNLIADQVKEIEIQSPIQNISIKKVIKVIKIQNKLDSMKKKISQRKSKQQNRGKLSFREQKQKVSKHLQKINQNDHQIQRNNSTNLFDKIQDYLANPHQNGNNKLKLSQRLSQSNVQKNKARLQQKIRLIEQKLFEYQSLDRNQNKQQNIDQNNKTTENRQKQIQSEQELLKKQSTIIAKLLSESQLDSYHEESSMISDYGMHWHRYEAINDKSQKHNIKKSTFEKQLKYIEQLQQRNNQNLLRFVQNQKLLHQIKLNKNKLSIQKKFGQQFQNKILASV